MNPLLNGNNNSLMQTINTIKSMKNPQSFINQLLQNNPQVKQVMQYVNNNGGDPKTAFYKMAKEKGVNPDDILNMLR